MKRTYLIDSENINDVWVELLGALEDKDDILVFYTDKSAHMGYDKIIRLMEQKKGTVRWIKCFEGQNALDFQLVTELGCRIVQEPKKEYVIVSNDTGYDVVVRYWQQRDYKVRRIRGTECEKMVATHNREMERERREEEVRALELLTEERRRMKAEEEKAKEKEKEKEREKEKEKEKEKQAAETARRRDEAEERKKPKKRRSVMREAPEPVEPEFVEPDLEETEPELVELDLEEAEPELVELDLEEAEPELVELDLEKVAPGFAEPVTSGFVELETEPEETPLVVSLYLSPDEVGAAAVTSDENGAGDEDENRSGDEDSAEDEDELFPHGVNPSENWKDQMLRIFREAGSRDEGVDMDFLKSLCKTVKISNMSLMHNVLEYQFGQRIGNGIYRILKSSSACRSDLSAGYLNSKKLREKEYLRLVLKRSGMSEIDADMILKILNAVPKKNLNAIHTALVKKFGQEQGARYYAALRSHVKIIRGL